MSCQNDYEYEVKKLMNMLDSVERNNKIYAVFCIPVIIIAMLFLCYASVKITQENSAEINRKTAEAQK